MGEKLDWILRDLAPRLFDRLEPRVAIIPLACGNMRGELTVGVHDALAGDACPIPPLHSASDLADWAFKLAGELLGRVERGLPHSEVAIDVGAPRIMTPAEARANVSPEQRARSERYVAAAGGVTVRLEVIQDARIAFRPSTTACAMATQDILLF